MIINILDIKTLIKKLRCVEKLLTLYLLPERYSSFVYDAFVVFYLFYVLHLNV